MPTAYDELLLEASPQVIGNSRQYDSIMSRVGVLIRKGRNRTPEETKLMRLLSVLIQDYDRKHAIPPEESTPEERLRYLLEVSHKTPADLILDLRAAKPHQQGTQRKTADQRSPNPQAC